MLAAMDLLGQATRPLEMPPVQWPISPGVVIAPFLALIVVCGLLILLAWWFRWRWLLDIVWLILPGGDNEPQPGVRRRSRRRRR